MSRALSAWFLVGIFACSSAKQDNVGVASIRIEALRVSRAPEDVEHGRTMFSWRCALCHRSTQEVKIGPGLAGVTARRSTAWIQRMLLDPATMEREDPIAKQLASAFPSERPEHGVDPRELPALIAYLTSLEEHAP